MSAAAEYYGWLLSQGYGEHQLNKFADYAKKADRGEISHNQAYRLACKAGFKGVDGWNNQSGDSEQSDKAGFGSWMQTAKEAGWIDAGLGIIGGLIGRRNQAPPPPPPPPPKKNNTALYVGLGVAVVGLGVAIYFITRKKR